MNFVQLCHQNTKFLGSVNEIFVGDQISFRAVPIRYRITPYYRWRGRSNNACRVIQDGRLSFHEDATLSDKPRSLNINTAKYDIK